MTSETSANEGEAGPRSTAYVAVAALTLAYMMSFADRQIPALLIGPIQRDLAIGDTQVSLLLGTAFAVFYATAAAPLAWLADRWSRKGVILLGVTLWAAMTGLSGLAMSFPQLFIARLGVGLGEAALTPSAYAIINDLFSPEKRSRAMSVFVLGASAGAGLALLIGGWAVGSAAAVGHQGLFGLAPWRLVLLGLGAATLLTLFPLAAIRLACRSTVMSAGRPQTFVGLAALVWRRRGAFAPLFLAAPLMNLAMYGAAAWSPTLLIRRYGWSEADAGLKLGLTQLAAGVAGALAFGWLSDRLHQSRGVDAPLTVIAWSAVAAAATIAGLFWSSSAAADLWILALFTFFCGAASVLSPVALQALAPTGGRAQLASLFLLVGNLVGIGLGPTAVAALTDFVLRDPNAVGLAISMVGAATFLTGALVIGLCAPSYRRLASETAT